ncbi:hypothetical protein P5673_024374 [Acropora cervicornis]|uniref:Uncharacterized protein n=1 Tax=Acropora cervicornis TaxID=6130 RepID=A0AAD9Q3L9_ACRCE|nr:hypothetical protein P5673_024374 [Acropora cervicornis]
MEEFEVNSKVSAQRTRPRYIEQLSYQPWHMVVRPEQCTEDSSDDEDDDGSDDDTANGFGTSLEPQAKKVRK